MVQRDAEGERGEPILSCLVRTLILGLLEVAKAERDMESSLCSLIILSTDWWRAWSREPDARSFTLICDLLTDSFLFQEDIESVDFWPLELLTVECGALCSREDRSEL